MNPQSKEFHIPQSVHGSVYADEWFQGISWNSNETLIAYVAEEPSPSKQTFTCKGYKRGSTTDGDFGNWKGQGEWEEGWGQTYAGKRQPTLFVININSGETQAVKGIGKCSSVGQVVWVPPRRGSHQYLVFVGWSADTRKLGIKYCYNRPCALNAVRAPIYESEADGQEINCQVVLSVNVLSGEVLRICPSNSNFSWNVLSLDGDNIFAVSSSLVDVPHIKYDYLVDKERKSTAWNWSDVPSPTNECSEKVESLLSSLHFSIMKIPVRDVSDTQTKGPFSFGEEALQSLPGNIGSQDVNDVLVTIDHVIDLGLASPSKIAVLGGSHGGFLTTQLIGQAPEKFVAAATRNPACNLALMAGTTDIPDWCYVEAYGSEGKHCYTESPSAEHLAFFHSKSPISYISKAKTPTLFLLGAQDIRLPISIGLQYGRALKEKGVAVKVIVFPNDNHPIDRPQSDFESFLNIGVSFKKCLL